MLKLIFKTLLLVFIGFSHVIGQDNHGFIIDPGVEFGRETYLFRGMYTPNKKDFFYISHSNFISEPQSIVAQNSSRSTFGYRRSIFRIPNKSFLYGQILFDRYSFESIFGAKAGFGWMQSLGQNIFLDINPSVIYHSRDIILGAREEHIVYLHLPIHLRAFMSISDFKSITVPEDTFKWRIRKHNIELTMRDAAQPSFPQIIYLIADLNLGYRIKKWIILEGILNSRSLPLTASEASSDVLNYGLGISVQPYRWKRFVPTAGISLENEYLGRGIRNASNRDRNTIISNAYIGLELKMNKHYSWSFQYNIPLINGIQSLRQFEIGSVYSF